MGQVELFERVEDCGENWETRLWCQSDSCAHARASGDPEAGAKAVPVGCSSRFFCPECRNMQAWRFRRDFNAARAGLLWQAELQGLTGRWRPKAGPDARLGERLVTLTAPHVGTAEERVRWAFEAWTPFLKRWNAYINDCFSYRIFRKNPFTRRMKLERHPVLCEGSRDREPLRNDDGQGVPVRELCHEARFFEWTQGDDGEGHPHFHLWAFGPYMPQPLIELWWREAWCEASGHDIDRIVVDVRAVKGDEVEVRDANGRPVVDAEGRPKKARIDHELIKYLTKEWEAGEHASPEVFARLWAELSPRRARQTSRGFGAWALPILRTCERCGISHETGEDHSPFRWRLVPKAATAVEYLLHPKPPPEKSILPELPPIVNGPKPDAPAFPFQRYELHGEWLTLIELKKRIRGCIDGVNTP